MTNAWIRHRGWELTWVSALIILAKADKPLITLPVTHHSVQSPSAVFERDERCAVGAI